MIITLNTESKHDSYYLVDGSWSKSTTNTVDIIVDALSEEWLRCYVNGTDDGVKNYGRDLFAVLKNVFHVTPTCVDGDDPIIQKCTEELEYAATHYSRIV